MRRSFNNLKPVVAALFLAAASIALPVPAAQAQTADLPTLYQQLADPETANWQAVERQIWTEWSRSGSASMDFLLERGRDAMEAEDLAAAIEHLTALTDHAPDFAEGWHVLATALYRAGKVGPAIEDIGRTLTLNPRHFGAMTGLALILEELGYPEDALATWRLVEAIHPNHPELSDALERLEHTTGGTAL